MALTADQRALYEDLKIERQLDDPPRSRGQNELQARNTVVDSFRHACMLDADAVPSAEDVLDHWSTGSP